MVDLATLMVKVDATEAGKAAGDLDKLTAAGKRSNVTVEQAERYMRKASVVLGDMAKAERTASVEAERLAKSTKGAGQAAADMAREAQRSAAATKQVTGMTNAAAFASRNLGYQLSDVVTQLASGTPPMRVFAQQGFQIVDALTMMRAEAAKTGQSMTSMIVGSFGKAGPLIVAAGLAVGAFAGALRIVQDDLNETGKVTLSYSDVALGTFDAIRAYVVDKLGPAFEWLADTVGAVWQYISDAAKAQANFMIGVMIAVPNTIYAAFTTLPAAVAELFVNMANGAIKVIEDLVNKAISGLNSFSGMVNSLLGTSIGGVGNVSFGRIENNFAGAGKRAGIALAAGVASGYGDHVGKAIDAIRPFAEARRIKRLSDDAEKAGGKAGRAGGAAAGKAMADEWGKTLEEITKDLSQSMAGLNKELHETVDALMKASDADFDKTLKEIGDKVPQIVTDTERWNAQLERTVGYLSQMGGAAGVIGRIGAAYQGLSTGDFGGVGGSIGSFLGQLNETEAGKGFLTKFRGTLDDFFGGAGKFTEALGAFGLAVSANQLIGDIFGFKGGPLGVLTGLVESVMPAKKGRATFSGGLDYSITGNSAKRMDAVGGIGGSVVDSLQAIASALGVNLSGFNGTVSVRKDSLRYDPSGQGITRTSKGALDFGQDEAALVAAVIKDAIADGAFAGLSEGFKNYLTSGDVESRLQDVLNLKGVMNEAASLRDPQGAALGELDKWRTSMLAIATATGEGMADVEYVYGERRKDILAQTGTDLVELERDRKGLLIQIAELEGRSVEALAMAREIERSAADESLRPLYDRIYALQDEATATAIAAQNAANFAQWALANNNMTLRLLEAEGNATGALALKRAMEIDATEESLRPILQRIYALEDEKTAADAAATAAAKLAAEQDALAASAAKAAEELAAAQKAIATEAFGLGKQWLEVTGQTQKLRELTLAGLGSDEARTIQQQIWNYQDALVAQEAATKANEAALDAQKTAQENATKAIEEYYNALQAARENVRKAYETQRNELTATIDKFSDFARTMREFRFGLMAANDNVFKQSRGQMLASAGGSDFISNANRFLDLSKSQSSSRMEYSRDVALVAAQALQMENEASGKASAAEQQLVLLEKQVSQYIVLTDTVEGAAQSLADAIAALQVVTAAAPVETTVPITDKLGEVVSAVESAAERQAASEAMVLAALQAIARSTGSTDALLRILENGGSLAISTRTGDTITSVAA